MIIKITLSSLGKSVYQRIFLRGGRCFDSFDMPQNSFEFCPAKFKMELIMEYLKILKTPADL